MKSQHSLVNSFSLWLTLGNFKTRNWKSLWLSEEISAPALRVLHSVGLRLTREPLVSSAGLSQVRSQCWGKQRPPGIRKDPLNCPQLKTSIVQKHRTTTIWFLKDLVTGKQSNRSFCSSFSILKSLETVRLSVGQEMSTVIFNSIQFPGKNQFCRLGLQKVCMKKQHKKTTSVPFSFKQKSC